MRCTPGPHFAPWLWASTRSAFALLARSQATRAERSEAHAAEPSAFRLVRHRGRLRSAALVRPSYVAHTLAVGQVVGIWAQMKTVGAQGSRPVRTASGFSGRALRPVSFRSMQGFRSHSQLRGQVFGPWRALPNPSLQWTCNSAPPLRPSFHSGLCSAALLHATELER